MCASSTSAALVFPGAGAALAFEFEEKHVSHNLALLVLHCHSLNREWEYLHHRDLQKRTRGHDAVGIYVECNDSGSAAVKHKFIVSANIILITEETFQWIIRRYVYIAV
jgi:hypothetical protein